MAWVQNFYVAAAPTFCDKFQKLRWLINNMFMLLLFTVAYGNCATNIHQ